MTDREPYIPSFETIMRRACRQYRRQEHRRRIKCRTVLVSVALLSSLTVGSLLGMVSIRGRAPMLHAQLVVQCQTAQTDAADAYNRAAQAQALFLHRFEKGQLVEEANTGELLGLRPDKPSDSDCTVDPQRALDTYQHETAQLEELGARFQTAKILQKQHAEQQLPAS